MDAVLNFLLNFREVLQDKTVLLVTHQLQYVQRADKIFLATSGGRIESFGNYHDLIASGSNFSSYVKDNESAESTTTCVIKVVNT